MGKGSIRYIKAHGNKISLKPVSKGSVIYGNFPKYVYKKSPIEKFNKFLGFVLLLLVVFSLVMYYFVSDSEKNMNKISREIVTLTNENIELQNKLDNLHSFNKVDEFIKNNSTLDTAKRIIEIPAVNVVTEPKVEPLQVRYKWSVGY